MKLAIATPLYPPESGGPATYAKLLEDELPARGWEVELVKFGDTKHYAKGIRHIVYMWRAYQAARRADKVLALDPVSVGFPAYIATRAAGKPFYLKMVGDYAWEQGTQRFGVMQLLDDFVKPQKRTMPVHALQWVESTVARGATRVITPSAYLKRIVATWGVPEDRIEVAYNAPPVLEEEPLNHPIALPQKPYIASVARLVPWKGFDSLLLALQRLRDGGSDLRLAVVGGGPERHRLELLAAELGIKEFVTFTGALPHAMAAAYIRHADAFVLNTGYEGFSHTILEAFQLGVPVVTTPVGGNTEQVTDGESGLLFPYNDVIAMADAIARIGSDAMLRARLIEGGTRKLESFTRAKLIERITAILA